MSRANLRPVAPPPALDANLDPAALTVAGDAPLHDSAIEAISRLLVAAAIRRRAAQTAHQAEGQEVRRA